MAFSNDCGLPARDQISERVDFLQKERGKKAAMLLFTGAMAGLLGFAFVGFIGQWQFARGPREVNFRGEPFASGNNFFPVSISDMVHDDHTPQGKCFFAFCLVAAVCILVSFYPYHLRNVYVGDDNVLCGMSWLTLRAILPPMGLMLCAAVTMTPIKQASFADKISTGVHGLGAGLFLMGYVIFEIQALYFSDVVHLDKKGGEKQARTLCVVGCVLAMAVQVTCTALALNGDKIGLCCSDVWQVPTLEDIAAAQRSSHPYTAVEAMEAFESGTKMLLNTSSGAVLAITQTAYWGEAFSGIFMVAGLLTIWWYSPERRIDLSEQFLGPGCEGYQSLESGS